MEGKTEKRGMRTTAKLWNLPSRQWKQLEVCERGHGMFRIVSIHKYKGSSIGQRLKAVRSYRKLLISLIEGLKDKIELVIHWIWSLRKKKILDLCFSNSDLHMNHWSIMGLIEMESLIQ